MAGMALESTGMALESTGMALEWIEVALEWTKIDDVAAKSLIKTLFQWII
jgi:hypothetical protein